MLDVELIVEYQALFEQVPPMLWTLAHFNVTENIDLPDRGPIGDPVNEVRINIFLSRVIQEIHRLREERGG